MSRAYNARRKARRQAQAVVKQERPRSSHPRADTPFGGRITTLLPILVIVAIFAVVGLLRFGVSVGVSKAQVDREVAALLNGIPQRGTALGSPSAPVTVWMYADLECPTVKLFVENYLSSIIDTWVRPGAARLEFRSLETDTADEEVFFQQESAALAAGRQNRMWNYVLTFVRQQQDASSGYVTDGYLADIASQVPGLEPTKWHRDRSDARLYRQVAFGVHAGRTAGLVSTPSLLLSLTEGVGGQRSDRVAIQREVGVSLASDIQALREEELNVGDSPTIRTLGASSAAG